MADMLANGVSGLLAFQQALDTTSHNISNASTDGYSRQTVDFATRQASLTGGSWIGSGVDVSAVSRSYDALLTTQVRNATSSYQQLNTQSTLAATLTNTLSDSTTGLSAALQTFSSSLQTLSSSPSDSAARQTVLSDAGTLVTRLKSYQNSIDQLSDQVESNLSDEMSQVNSLAQNIATLNQKILAARGQSSSSANDLLDQRDQLVTELSQHIDVSTVTQDDGSLNVYVGSGEGLVVGTTANALQAVSNQYGSDGMRIGIQNGAYVADITDSIAGGTMGGLLQVRSQTLGSAQQSLGQIATGLATQLNNVQAQGLDLNGDVGTALFALGSVTSVGAGGNTGSASVSATRSDVSAIGSGTYTLAYDGSNWSLTNDATGTAATLSGSGTAADPLVGDGMSLVISGAAQAGDKFSIDPWGNAVSGMSVAISDPNKLAAANQLATAATSTNTGSGTIDAGKVTDTSAWVRGDYTLKFTSASAWTISDASGNTVTGGAYTAGSAIDFNGMEVTVSGTPASGDSFTINDNANGSGDNRNAQSMIATFDTKYLNGGKTSVDGAVDAFTTSLSTQASQLQTAADAQKTALSDATSSQQSVSGVNLDEEAAKLIQYQQAYQAAAQVISVSNSLFDSLITALRS